MGSYTSYCRYRTQCYNNVRTYHVIGRSLWIQRPLCNNIITISATTARHDARLYVLAALPRLRESDHFGPTCARRRWSTAAPGNRPRLSSGSWCMGLWRGCTSMSCGWPVPWTGTRSCSRPSARWENSCRSCLRCGHWWVTTCILRSLRRV